MPILNTLRYRAGAGVRYRLRREAGRFLALAADCRSAQQAVLKRLLRLNADSRFSRQHRFRDVRTVADFRRQMPIADYEYFRDPIERLTLGDTRALLGAGNPLLMFSLSSGTTSEAKYIPITGRFLRDYRRGWQLWGIWAFDDHPGLHRKSIVQLTSDNQRFRTPGGTPCGNISGLVAGMQNRVVRLMYSVPACVAKIPDPEAKYYTALRLALADPNVGMVSTANPSTLVHMFKLADAEKSRLIRDIADGTLSDRFDVPAGVRRRLRGRLSSARRERAKFLDRIVERTGRLYPSGYWPRTEALAVWTGGSAAAYLRALFRYSGEVPVRDHGLHASEGRMTIPMQDGSSAGILEVDTHFFEFIPEEEYGTQQPTVLEAHELEPGRHYYVLLTTSSGLYRYDICDVVCCLGFEGTTPVLEFLHKGAHIANVTGEKVSESQVVEAVRFTLEQLRLHLEHFTVSPVFGEPPHYQIFVEQQDLPDAGVAERLALCVDESLQQLNCEYAEKRLSSRLGPLQPVPLPAGTWERFLQHRQSRLGGSIEQYKHPCLVPDMQFADQFLNRFAVAAAQPFLAASTSQNVHAHAG